VCVCVCVCVRVCVRERERERARARERKLAPPPRKAGTRLAPAEQFNSRRDDCGAERSGDSRRSREESPDEPIYHIL